MPVPKNLKAFLTRKARAQAQGKAEHAEQVFQKAVFNDFVIPEEPLLYSLKYSLIGRFRRTIVHFRNMQFKSIIKCCMPCYMNVKVPVCLFVRFYVSPPSGVYVSDEDLAKEQTPAVRSGELCDYLLSFQELLFSGLFNSYKQVVKLEADKFYSAKPRTVFQFMKWEHYVRYKNNHPIYTQTRPFGQIKLPSRKVLQSTPQTQGDYRELDRGEFTADRCTSPIWSASGSLSLSNADKRPNIQQAIKARAAEKYAALPKTRRRQSGKIPKRHIDGEALEGRLSDSLDATLEVDD